MGKYSSRVSKPPAPKRNVVNPYMRGVGCLLILAVPVFSYGVGSELSKRGFGVGVLPVEWYDFMQFPSYFYALPGLARLADFFSSIPRLPATLALAVVVMIVVGGILSVIFGWMYSLFAPSQYGPMDVPPPRVKTKKYRR